MASHCDLSQKKCLPCKAGTFPLKGEPLAQLHRELGRNWKMIEEHHLEKEYAFKNFQDALAFTNQVGAIAELEGHHPDLFLSYGKVKIQLWTHKICGLCENDFILAAKCDAAHQRLNKTKPHISFHAEAVNHDGPSLSLAQTDYAHYQEQLADVLSAVEQHFLEAIKELEQVEPQEVKYDSSKSNIFKLF